MRFASTMLADVHQLKAVFAYMGNDDIGQIDGNRIEKYKVQRKKASRSESRTEHTQTRHPAQTGHAREPVRGRVYDLGAGCRHLDTDEVRIPWEGISATDFLFYTQAEIFLFRK